MWNVRGLNAHKKQLYLDRLIRDQRPDIIMLNETKLTSKLFLEGYFSYQTLSKRSGGCITFSNLRSHRKVKALGTYLSWSKVLLGNEELHILNVYLEPGHDSFVVKRADIVVALVMSIIRQDAAAKIIIGGDLNGQLQKVHTALMLASFSPALKAGTVTHREGNQLDQLWTRNVTILQDLVGDLVDQVSDHNPILVKLEATLIERGQAP